MRVSVSLSVLVSLIVSRAPTQSGMGVPWVMCSRVVDTSWQLSVCPSL